MDSDEIEGALTAVGELLAADRERVAVVVVGGATMSLLGHVRRTTRDVDVIARAHPRDDGTMRLERAEPLPPALQSAILTVARDFRPGIDPGGDRACHTNRFVRSGAKLRTCSSTPPGASGAI
jgi:hypothetical protein